MAGQRFASAQHPQFRIAAPAGLDQQLPCRRSRLQNACAPAPQAATAAGTVFCFCLASDHDFRADRERKEKFEAAMSKQIVVTAAMVSSAVKPGVTRMAHRKLVSAPCEICTPFGWPVEPEVKMM